MFKDRFPTTKSFIDYVEATYDRYQRKERWVTGGQCGGNCYGDDANQSVDAEEEPDLAYFDELLMEVIPDLTFLEYRKMMKAEGLIVRTTWYDNEYYGNYTTGAEKTVDLDVLYQALLDIVERR